MGRLLSSNQAGRNTQRNALTMPLPTRSQSVRSTQKSNDKASHSSQTEEASRISSHPGASLGRALQASTTAVKKASAGPNLTVSKAPPNSHATRVTDNDASKQNQTPVASTTSSQTSPRNLRNKVLPSQTPSHEPQPRPQASQHKHSRNVSTVTTSSRIPARGHQRTQSIPTHRITTRDDVGADLKKPGFTTFQQHYSPRKPNTRTVDASSTAPKLTKSLPSVSENNVINDELLQLQILHQQSADTLRKYRISAQQYIEDVQIQQERKEASILQNRRDYARLISLDSLGKWLGSEEQPIAQHMIQQLSRTVEDIADLLRNYEDPDGPLYRFTSWYEHTCAVRMNRQNRPISDPGSLSVPSLGDNWKVEMTSLVDKASRCKYALSSLEPPQQDESGIYAVFRRHLALAETLHRSAEVVLGVERGVTALERKWMAQEIESAISEHHFKLLRVESDEHVPAWHL